MGGDDDDRVLDCRGHGMGIIHVFASYSTLCRTAEIVGLHFRLESQD